MGLRSYKIAFGVFLLLLASCGQNPSNPSASISPRTSATPTPPIQNTVPTPTQDSPVSNGVQVLSGWLNQYTQHIEMKVFTDHSTLLNLDPSRMKTVCPRWDQLSLSERKSFWSTLLWSVSDPESNYQRTLIYRETALSIDKVTGQQVRSEGLLQLSYADVVNYHYPGSDISWEKDRTFALQDYSNEVKIGNSNRTIFNAYANFNLGLWIMDRLLINHSDENFEEALSRYWSSMNPAKSAFKRVRTNLKTQLPVCFELPQWTD